MKKVKIHWIDVAGNERMFITNVENANNNWHAISQTVEKLYKIHDYKTFQGVLEIEKIECIER